MSLQAISDPIVSYETDPLILVDEQDQATGFLDKAACHDGEGLLHRAFSVFIFNEHGEVLLQRRAEGKRLWPGYWSNSCCSHPRAGEEIAEAARRRTEQELGLHCDLTPLYAFTYHARFQDLGAEWEHCHVLVGQLERPRPKVNRHEISAWRWVSPTALSHALKAEPEHYTPWLALEWAKLRADYGAHLPVALP